MEALNGHGLSDRVLKWIVKTVNSNAEIQSIERLRGSTSSVLHSVSFRSDEGESRRYVLRQFTNAEWLQQEPDLALHEAESLRRAASAGVQTPQIIAYEETGSACGVPVVLMSQLEGQVVLRPENLNHWLDVLAQSLVKIHAVEADGYPWSYFTYNDLPSLQIPTWSKYPDSWRKVIQTVQKPQPLTRQCFIHRDYHPANVLWTGNSVSGVVDWVNACRGPAGIDVGHCRLNLAQLFDVSTADTFLKAYQKHAGSAFSYDPFWDMLSLIDILFGTPEVYPGWAAFGVTDLTDGLIIKRLDAYMLSLVERHTGAGG